MKDSKDGREKPHQKDDPPGPHHWRIRKWFPDLPQEIEDKLKAYQTEIIYFNGRINLISPRTEGASDLIHIADGILGSQIIAKRLKSKEIFDLGSGNGIPGIIFALLNPKIKVNLVEADGRKIEYLKHCIAKTGLKNCMTVHARLEDLKEGAVKAAMTRGLASISKCLLMARRCAGEGCEFYHFKGQAWTKEIAEIPSQILASWEPSHVEDYHLPEGGPHMTIMLTTRVDL